MAFLQNIFIVCLIKLIFVNGRPEGYRYSNFYGPVSGPATEIEIEPEVYNHKGSFDYFAKPDYSFSYGVEDPKTGNYQNQKEYRDGDFVKGEYSVVEPDGSIRTVVYSADPKNGFQATVHISEPNEERALQQQNVVKIPEESLEFDY